LHAHMAWRTDAPKRATIALVALALTLPLLITRPASAAIAEPNQTGPSDGATLSFPTEPPLFQWDAVAGATSYRIEIDCSQMMKRCYTNETGTWQQTYGRHCRASLGESCYLADCDAKCQ